MNTSSFDKDIYKFDSSKLISNSNKHNFDKEFFVSKDVDDYFNNILNTKDKKSNFKILNTSSTLKNFYQYYIYPNALLIVLLVAVVIFFIIRYLCSNIKGKNSDNFNNINNNDKINDNIINNTDDVIYNSNEIENNNNKLKAQKDKEQLKKEKKEIRKEKLKILEIIDELSTMNSNANIKYSNNNYNNNSYRSNNNNNGNYGYDDSNEYDNQNDFSNYSNNIYQQQQSFGDSDNFSNYSSVNNYENDSIILKKYGNNYAQNHPTNSFDSFQEPYFDNGSFQSLEKGIDSNNYINDMYIEPPYM